MMHEAHAKSSSAKLFWCYVVCAIICVILTTVVLHVVMVYCLTRENVWPQDLWDSRLLTSGRNTTLLTSDRFCQRKTDVLAIVCSAPEHFRRRLAIRKTWASITQIDNTHIDVFFLVGVVNNKNLQMYIEKESRKYNDILQEYFLDTYNNLSMKSLMMLKLVKSGCIGHVQYLLKADDDTYVNVPALLKLLEGKPLVKLLLGCLQRHAKPVRNEDKKWYTPFELYEKDLYPDYLSGSAYVLSIDLVVKLLEMSYVIPIFQFEDVYITGILAEGIGEKPQNHNGFTLDKRPMNDSKDKEYIITSHYLESHEMHIAYKVWS